MCWPAFVDFNGSSLCPLDLDICLLPQIKEVFCYYFLKQIFCSFFAFFFFWDSYNSNVIMFDGALSSLILFLCCIIFLFLLCSASLFSIFLSSRSLIHSSFSSSLLFFVSSLFPNSFMTFVISDCFFFSSFIFLLSS